MKKTLYHYRAIVTKVYDGDTCTVDIDLGLRAWLRGEKIRLRRINAPELRKESREAGLRSRDFLRELILGKEIILETIKDRRGLYGRYLGEIWLLKDGQYVNINDIMVEQGYAVPLEY